VIPASAPIKVYVRQDFPLTPGPAPAVTTAKVSGQVTCRRIDEDGRAVEASNTFQPHAPRIFTWFQVAPVAWDRVLEVQWLSGDRAVQSTWCIVPADQARGWSVLRRPESGDFSAGPWKVVVKQDGAVLSEQEFRVTE